MGIGNWVNRYVGLGWGSQEWEDFQIVDTCRSTEMTTTFRWTLVVLAVNMDVYTSRVKKLQICLTSRKEIK